MLRSQMLRLTHDACLRNLPCIRHCSGVTPPQADVKSLENKIAMVVGGVGVIGRGICRGLLKAGATVLVNSRSQQQLQQLYEDLNHPANLVGIVGTMRPSGAQVLVQEAMDMTSNRIDYVVAHCGVRWWAQSGYLHDTSITDCIPGAGQSDPLGLEISDFRERTSELPALHYTAAQLLLPRMLQVPGSSYIFVTGGAGERRSIISQVNAHAIWGLARGLREHYEDEHCRVIELRSSLPIGRGLKERSADPRARPLSADIGEICAGLAGSQYGSSKSFYDLRTLKDVEDIKSEHPCPDIVSDLPVLWHWQRASRKAST